MIVRYRYRAYPTAAQAEMLARTFGCARVVFNDALAARQAAYVAGLPYVTDAALSARLTAAKATPERAWLSEVSAMVRRYAGREARSGGPRRSPGRTWTRRAPT